MPRAAFRTPSASPVPPPRGRWWWPCPGASSGAWRNSTPCPPVRPLPRRTPARRRLGDGARHLEQQSGCAV